VQPPAPTAQQPAPSEIPPDLAEAGFYPTATEGFEHGLVVLAMGHAFWLLRHDSGYRLLIEPQWLDPVRHQLAGFDRENTLWPPPPIADASPARKIKMVTPLLWALAVLAVFRAENQYPGRLEALGAVDPQAIFHHGEWWRLGTALFLHADLSHLLSNLFSGVFIFSAVVTTIGLVRGWLLLALSSIAGNLAAAAMHYSTPYESLGASTAIFAGLGLLTGRAIRAILQTAHPHRWRAVFVPFASGAILLGLYGAGGVEVDALAHVTGFAAGLAAGAAVAKRVNVSSQK